MQSNTQPRAPKVAYWKRSVEARAENTITHTRVALVSVSKRLAGRARLCARWSVDGDGYAAAMNDNLALASRALTAAIEALAQLPSGYVPLRPATATAMAASTKLSVGSTVSVREKYRQQYDLVLTATEMDSLTVLACKGSTVVATSGDGKDRLVFKRAYLAVV